MDEPPLKRARHDDVAAKTRERSNRQPRDTEATERHQRSRASHDASEHDNHSSSRTEDGRRRRSRSPKREDRERDRHRQRSRSPTGRDRDYRDRQSGRHGEASGREQRDRERVRSRSRERHHDHSHGTSKPARGYNRNERKRSHSRSPSRNGTSSANSRHVKTESSDRKYESKSSLPNGSSGVIKQEAKGGDMDVDDDSVDAMMKRLMGFSTFKTTQNTKVPGNQIYGVRKEKKTEYRQYMNRVGGFNRPLSPGA